MKSLKSYLAFIIPLFILLFSIQFAIMLDRSVKSYEAKLSGEYTIVVVAKDKIKVDELKKRIPQISLISELDKQSYLEKFKKELSKSDFALLKATLPNFYSIKLNTLPSVSELNSISATLKESKNITKVETFKKTFNKFHQFLKLTKTIVLIFSFLIFIISFLLIIKQMEIWSLEHKQRMYIMGLFGAPFWIKSASLYKSVIIGALISAILTSILFINLPNFQIISTITKDINLEFSNFSFGDFLKLILLSLAISIISVTTIILRQKKV